LVKVRVKLGSAEAEVESDPEHLREAIDLIPALIEKLPRPVEHDGAQPKGHGSPLVVAPITGDVPLPNVTIGKEDSLADIIGKFFSDSWGRDRRKLTDVREALQSYGLSYPKQSVAVALLRLAKATRIRRFKAEDGEYVYTAAAAAATSREG